MGEREVCFPLNLPKPHLAYGTFKDDVIQHNCYHNLTVRCTYPCRRIAEYLRIAFLQSNLFWQISCAKPKTKACTEISALTINATKPITVVVFVLQCHLCCECCNVNVGRAINKAICMPVRLLTLCQCRLSF